MNETPGIRLTSLTKRFGALTAVDDIDLTVPTGQILALLGPNGAGKSTTTEMILGITRPDAGEVRVFGRSPVAATRAGDLGAMLQNGTLLWDTKVGRLLRGMRALHSHPLPLDRVIELADVGEFLSTSTSKLSGGQAQRVRFALAIMADPRLLILDEPTVGLDALSRRRFWDTMADFAATGRTVVFATHYLDEADEFADRIVVLNKGCVIADGTGREIRQVVGGRIVSFTGPERDWTRLPGVLAATSEDGRHQLSCSDSDATLRALFTLDGAEVRDVEVTSPSLEDAFLALTEAA
ncbi:MAG: ABC transporter ATP-binding protein [Tessaracoccus sp.]|uniref:ABC transporter ATP-binding protein n=1 Tax=Tessaracoccus sp. TaxID=1971211 RepID=UPI001EC5701F|nr:ABC transporter ATP-binding protein [Tessaracoccus sp.]MBK7819879.1 ABC transporter ATP-binding protein [Tessaracoccus sp.]